MRACNNKQLALSVIVMVILMVIIAPQGGRVVARAQSDTEVDQNTIDAIQKQIEEQQRTLDELHQQAQEQESTLLETKRYADTLQGHVDNFNREIRQLQGKITITEQEIRYTQLAIQKTNLEIEKKESQIDTTKQYMAALFQEIYENDEESLVELLFKYENFSTFFNQVQARKTLNEVIGVKLDELKKLKQELEEAQHALAERKKRFEKEQTILHDQKIIIEQRRLSQRQLLHETREEESTYQEFLDKIRKQQEETQLEIFKLEQQLRNKLDPGSVPDAGALLSWPAEGILTQGYGCTGFAESSAYYPTCFHNGVDLASSSGTPIYAADGGMVLHSSNTPTAYGKWITIQHETGLITLYAHLSLQKVTPGQKVNRGDLVGYMGSTGLSTGPHLHFTVFVTSEYFIKPSKYSGLIPIGATLNPFNYLP